MASVLEQTPKAASGIVPLHKDDVLDQPTFHERYSAMPPGFRAELIGGVVYVRSPATNWHAVYHGDMIGSLFHYRAHTPGVDMLDGARYVNFPPDPDGVWRSQVIPGLWLNIQALLDRDGAALLKTLDAGLASEAHPAFVKQLKSATQQRQS